MRDDEPLRPDFRPAVEDERPLELRHAAYDPVQPPERVSPWRVALIGGVGAAVLGVAVALAVPGAKSGPDAKAAKPEPASYRTIDARYSPPDRERIAAAYRDVDQLVAQEGLAGAARASMACFERLERTPNYGLMDYCLALDAYGAAAYARAAGERAPESTYFGRGQVRRQQAVQMLTAGQTDANSRLIDTNRLIEQVAIQAAIPTAPAPTVAAVTVAPTAAVPAPGPGPALPPPAPREAVKVFRPAPAPAVVAQAVVPEKAAIKVVRIKPQSPAPAPSPLKPAKAVKAAKAIAPAPKPVQAKSSGKVAKAPKGVVAQARPARPLAVKTAKAPVLAKAAPAKPKAVAAAPKAKPPVAPPDSGPWINKLEAVLKRPATPAPQPSPAKPGPGPEAQLAPPPAKVQPAATVPKPAIERSPAAETVRPSFDCRNALSRGQQLVCREPSLAAADRRLSAAFNQALQGSDNPRALIADQNRWLGLRDRLAPNVPAVMSLYQDRIAELRRQTY